jgi:hypothetical protein
MNFYNISNKIDKDTFAEKRKERVRDGGACL